MLLCSKFLANSILKNIKKEVSFLKKKPGLGIILVGDRKDSKIYVNMKKKACEKVGIKHYQKNLCNLSTTESVINEIEKFNKNDNIDAIMVQLPLPEHLNKELILNKINYKKDVDCFHKTNFGKVALNLNKSIYPCTPKGIENLLDFYNIDTKHKNITIVGTSSIVGLPMSLMFLHKGATVTMCNKNTKDIKEFTKTADILVVAAGHPNLIDSSHIKDGCVVIDVGINKLECGNIVGDVNINDVACKVKAITPVPGGVGPMTISMVIQNTLELYKKKG